MQRASPFSVSHCAVQGTGGLLPLPVVPNQSIETHTHTLKKPVTLLLLLLLQESVKQVSRAWQSGMSRRSETPAIPGGFDSIGSVL